MKCISDLESEMIKQMFYISFDEKKLQVILAKKKKQMNTVNLNIAGVVEQHIYGINRHIQLNNALKNLK